MITQDYFSKASLYERKIVDRLLAKGFDILNVPILQNADIILDTIGERARSELFFVETENPEQKCFAL